MPEYYDNERRKNKKRDRKGEGPISRYKRKMYGDINAPYCEAGMRVDPKLYKKRDDERFERFGDDTESKEDLSHLNSVEKLLLAVEASIYYLPSEVAEEIKAIFTPATLATMVGVFAVYLAAHATGIGQAMDIGMLIAGGIYFGLDAFAIFKDIAGFAGAINATTTEELVEAGEHLASAVAKIGVDAVITLLTKKVADEVGKSVDNLNQVEQRREAHVVHAHSEGADASVSFDEIKYPEGTNIREDLPNHLRNFDGINRSGVRGTHNLDVFNQVVIDEGLEIVRKTEHSDIEGIYNIEYKIPKQDGSGKFRNKPQKKTLYDPAIHSDEKIVELGQRAAAQGMEQALSDGNRQFIENVEGIDFLVSIDLNTKKITNTHPIMD